MARVEAYPRSWVACGKSFAMPHPRLVRIVRSARRPLSGRCRAALDDARERGQVTASLQGIAVAESPPARDGFTPVSRPRETGSRPRSEARSWSAAQQDVLPARHHGALTAPVVAAGLALRARVGDFDRSLLRLG